MMEFRSYLRNELYNSVLLEVQLYLLASATSIQNAIAFPNCHYFTSNQTGNTALIAIGAFRISSNIFNLVDIRISFI